MKKWNIMDKVVEYILGTWFAVFFLWDLLKHTRELHSDGTMTWKEAYKKARMDFDHMDESGNFVYYGDEMRGS